MWDYIPWKTLVPILIVLALILIPLGIWVDGMMENVTVAIQLD